MSLSASWLPKLVSVAIAADTKTEQHSCFKFLTKRNKPTLSEEDQMILCHFMSSFDLDIVLVVEHQP